MHVLKTNLDFETRKPEFRKFIDLVVITTSEFDIHTRCLFILSCVFFFSFKTLVPPGLEPGTFRVLSERDNHYTSELLGKLCV